MYAQPGLGLLVEAAHAHDALGNRGPANLESGLDLCRPSLSNRILLKTGQWLVALGRKLQTANSHLHLAEKPA